MPKVATSKTLAKVKKRVEESYSWRKPLWKGPIVDGITFSMISKWLYCRERFKLQYVDGWTSQDAYNHRMEFGNLWHVCEENAAGVPGAWLIPLQCTAQGLSEKYPQDKSKISEAYSIIKRQFPIYLEKYKGTKPPKETETVFDVRYPTPGGKTVRLRGKLDGLEDEKEVIIQENKTISEIDSVAMISRMACDMQTMLYTIATELKLGRRVNRVRFNCVLRPLSGGKHTIKQHKGRMTKKGLKGVETETEFYDRLAALIKENQDHFFARFYGTIDHNDVKRFRTTCLDPILDQICDWYYAVTHGTYSGGIHFRYPYGVYNPTLEGYGNELDNYLASGSTAGLKKVSKLFTELG